MPIILNDFVPTKQIIAVATEILIDKNSSTLWLIPTDKILLIRSVHFEVSFFISPSCIFPLFFPPPLSMFSRETIFPYFSPSSHKVNSFGNITIVAPIRTNAYKQWRGKSYFAMQWEYCFVFLSFSMFTTDQYTYIPKL